MLVIAKQNENSKTIFKLNLIVVERMHEPVNCTRAQWFIYQSKRTINGKSEICHRYQFHSVLALCMCYFVFSVKIRCDRHKYCHSTIRFHRIALRAWCVFSLDHINYILIFFFSIASFFFHHILELFRFLSVCFV